MSRKRGKKKRAPEAVVAEEVLAEGSGPVTSDANAEPITADDIVTTTDDVMTADDVVTTTDDVVAAEAAPADVSDVSDVSDAPDVSDVFDVSDAPSDDVAEIAATTETDADAAGDPPGDPIEPVAAAEVTETDDGDDSDVAAAALPTSALTMEPQQLKLLIEALVFASDKPMTVQRLRQLTRVSDTKRLEQALADLAEDYRERGLVLQQVSGGYQFRTRTQFSAWVQQLIAGRPVRLSRAQLETLAIIAYRQPITRPEIDDIRGVDSSATLKLLLDRSLIRVLGKREEVGRPMLYGTTKEFLDFFSLGDLRELPTLREYSELSAESRQVMSDRLGIELDDAGEGEGGGGGEGGEGGGGGEGGPTGSDGGPGDTGPAGGFDPGAGGVPDPSAATVADVVADYLAAADAVDRAEAAADEAHDIAEAANDSAESRTSDDSPEVAGDRVEAVSLASDAPDPAGDDAHDIAVAAVDSAESQPVDDSHDIAAAADASAESQAGAASAEVAAEDAADRREPAALASDASDHAPDPGSAGGAMEAHAIAAPADESSQPPDSAESPDDPTWGEPAADIDMLAAVARRVIARAGTPEQAVDADPGWPEGSQRFSTAQAPEHEADEAARSVAADDHAIDANVLDEQHAAGAAEQPAEPTHE